MESKLKHLEFIQNVVTRMNSNSFLIKGWMIALISAVFVLIAKDSNIRYALITYIIIPVFWILDAFYLSQERQYRSLYDEMRKKEVTDFSMDASYYNTGKNTWVATIFSKTMLIFYLAVIIVISLVLFWIF